MSCRSFAGLLLGESLLEEMAHVGIDVLVSCAAGDPMVFVRVPLQRETVQK